jgi:endonuclease G
VESIGTKDDNGVSIPIPNAYFKSILTEDKNGDLHMWSFLLANEKSDKPLSSFLVPTKLIEKLSGLILWQSLTGSKIEQEKSQVRAMWKL